MVYGFSCILDFPKFSGGGPPEILIKGINQLNPQNLSSTITNSQKQKKKKAGKPESPPPLKQSTRNLSLGYTETEKRRRALGQYLFCVICNWAVWNFDLYYLISSQSLNLGGHRGTTVDIATIPFHPSLSSAALRESPNPIPVHSLMLSSYLFFCLPLLLAPFIVPCRIVFAMPEHLEMWPYHLSFRFLTMVRSSCIPVAFWILLRTSCSSHGLCRKCSEVSYSISSQGLGSFSLFLLSRSISHRHKGR